MYYKNADAIILIFDVQDRESYLDVFNYWLPEVESFAGSDVFMCVVGNKTDLPDRKVSQDEVELEFNERFINKKALLVETSIKEGSNMSKATNDLIGGLVQRRFGRQEKNLFV